MHKKKNVFTFCKYAIHWFHSLLEEKENAEQLWTHKIHEKASHIRSYNWQRLML